MQRIWILGPVLLLGQILSAEREFLQGLINEKEYGAVKNRVLAATIKLVNIAR